MEDKVWQDRRSNPHRPQPEDYETPVTPHTIGEANKRFRKTGMRGAYPDSNRDKAAGLVKSVTKDRNKLRKSGQDFVSIGEYLDHLNELGKHGD